MIICVTGLRRGLLFHLKLCLKLTFRRKGKFHQFDQTLIDLGGITRDLLGLHRLNFTFHVVDILLLDGADVVLKEALEDLLLGLAEVRFIESLAAKLKATVQHRLELVFLEAKCRVPIVLDGVVAASQEHIGDLSPSVLHGLVQDVENPLFLLCPLGLLEQRIELVVPAFTALLAGSVLHLLGHDLPLMWTDVSDHAQEDLILLLLPGSLV